MQRFSPRILIGVAIAGMLAGAWLALKPVFFREQIVIVSLLQRKHEGQPVADAVEEGIQLALEECGHRAGRFRVVEERREFQWAMDAVAGLYEGAEAAIENPKVVAVIGPSNYYGTSIAARLNRAGLLTVSPDERVPELTRRGFGNNYAPECYRPSGERTFFRTVSSEDVVERGAAEWASKHGARTVTVLGDNESQIRGDVFLRAATERGLKTVGDESQDSARAGTATRILQNRPDLVYLRGERTNGWAQTLIEAQKGGWPGTILVRGQHAARFFITGTPLPDNVYVVARAAPPPDFARAFAARFGRPSQPEHYYGYSAARAVVEAVERVGSNDRAAICRACAADPRFDLRGDPTFTALDVSRLRPGRLELLESFVPEPLPPDGPPPVLTISFHGTFGSQDHALGQMLNHSMRGTVYVDPDRVGQDGYLDWDDLRGHQNHGHEIALSAPTTTDVPSWLARMQSGKEAMRRERVSGSPGLYLPPGSPDSPEVRAWLATQGFQGRWVDRGGAFHTKPLPAGEYALETGARTLNDYQAVVDRALAEQKHVDLRFSRFEDEPGPDRFAYQDFRALLEYIDSRGFRVIPAVELYRGFTPEKPRDGR